METGVEETTFIKVDQCSNSVSDEMHKVSDWTKSYTDNIDDIRMAHEIQSLVHQIMNPVEFVKTISLVGVIYVEDDKEGKNGLTVREMIKQVLDTYMAVTIQYGYIEYDINRPFAEQAKENIGRNQKG